LLANVKENLRFARTSLTLPKRKSLVELCSSSREELQSAAPHDIPPSLLHLLAKLVCAAYQALHRLELAQLHQRLPLGKGEGGASEAEVLLHVSPAK